MLLGRWSLVVLMVASTSFGLIAQHAVMMTSFFDESRDRNIPADVFYPAQYPGVNQPLRGGPYPVVVFGHGMAMPVQSYRHLVSKFNENDYIMVLPKTEMGMSPVHEDFSADLAFMAEALTTESLNPASPVFGGVQDNFALVGHSMGGSAAFWSATLSDRFKTIVALSPPQFIPHPSEAASEIDIPVLIITGINDGVTSMKDHVLPIYHELRKSPKSLVGIKGGSHCGFANSNWLCNMGESILAPSEFIDRSVQHEITHDYLFPWLDFYLKANCETIDMMHQKALNDERISYTDDLHNFLEPCLYNNHKLIYSDIDASSYQWSINGVSLPGERGESISSEYGSGVYQCEMVMDNGCSVLSEEYWHFSDRTDVRGDFRFRLYQHPTSVDVFIEAFGVELPLEISVYDPSGNLLLRKPIQSHREDIQIDEKYSGMLFYSISQNGNVIGRGKVLRELQM